MPQRISENNMPLKICIGLFLVLCERNFAQTNVIDNFFFQLKQLEFEKAEEVISDYPNETEKLLLINLTELLLAAGQEDVPEADITSDSAFEEVLSLLVKGYRKLYYTTDKASAFKYFHESFEMASDIGYEPLIKATLFAIFNYYQTEFLKNSQQFQIYLNAFKSLKMDSVDRIHLSLYSLIFYSQTSKKPNAPYYNLVKQLNVYLKVVDPASRLMPRILYEKAFSLELNNQLDSAAYYYHKSFHTTSDHAFFHYIRFSTKIKLSHIAYQNKNYQRAFDLLKESKRYSDMSDTVRSNLFLNRYASLYYAGLGQFDSAYYDLKKSLDAEYKLDYRTNTLEINTLNVVLQTQQKELDNVRLRQKGTWLLIALSTVILLLLLSYLAYKNIVGKKKIVEKEREIQTQKVDALLKEQELLGIDAMIEGQEKERQRIANDLHDNLGSLLATLKLHLQHLRSKSNSSIDANLSTPELDKTDEILEEAYQKVRHLAHARNVGVKAQEGLLPGVKNFAARVSDSHQLYIRVIDHGMDEQLENSLEITLFRIIQELITNIIKHAEASEATIHLTRHANSLNVLVEDNGIGFDTAHTRPVSGMGLYSIRKRIENLKGQLTVESLHQKGTTVIIDIPMP